VNACTAELQTVLAAQNTARKQMLEQAATAVCAAWLQTIGEAIARLQQREREIRDALVALDGRVKAQQTQYVAERQKREVLSKVKETRYAEFVRKVGRQEQIVLDDMFLARRK
jgi:flagellar export protein FliJ